MTVDVPTTDEMRFAWADRVHKHNDEGGAEFDAWLAAHDRQVAERAWHEGFVAADDTDNPYRADSLAPSPATPALSVSGEQVEAIVARVAAQHFTDDEGFDVGTMRTIEARTGVLHTLSALGVTVTDGDAL